MMTIQRMLMILGGEQKLLFFWNRLFLILTSTTPSEPFLAVPTITTESWACLSSIRSIETFSPSMLLQRKSVGHFVPRMDFIERDCIFYAVPVLWCFLRFCEHCNQNFVYAISNLFNTCPSCDRTTVRWTMPLMQPKNIWQTGPSCNPQFSHENKSDFVVVVVLVKLPIMLSAQI